MTRRVFNKDNIEKLDRLLHFLGKKRANYCVFAYPDSENRGEMKFIVSWYGN